MSNQDTMIDIMNDFFKMVKTLRAENNKLRKENASLNSKLCASIHTATELRAIVEDLQRQKAK